MPKLTPTGVNSLPRPVGLFASCPTLMNYLHDDDQDGEEAEEGHSHEGRRQLAAG